jgi:TonB family protein
VYAFDGHCQPPTDGTIHVNELLNCPRLIHYVRPNYPKEAKRRHIQGTVKLRAIVGASGELRNIEVLEGDPMLVPAALRAVKEWRYSICRLHGTVVEPIDSIDVPFNLSQ